MIQFKNIEPFPLYPESIINTQEKAKKVLELNNYYFNVVGVFSIILGGVAIYNYTQDREILSLGIGAVISGVIYIFLSFFTKIFQSRITCLLLIIFSIGSDIFEGGIDAISGVKIIQYNILLAASYRMAKAVFYYNRIKF
ncbi:MAG: uncharacterized membrane protein HdeD (DUF308 family) [Desulforhopalus sp.]|jgi:uncharacterized membrane protein HdeD (DUF308 family)